MDKGEFVWHAFLTFSSKDEEVLRLLAESGRAGGLKAWFDESVRSPGDDIPTKIKFGLEHSRILALLASDDATGSDGMYFGLGTCGRRNLHFPDQLKKEHPFIQVRLAAAATEIPWRNSPTSTDIQRPPNRIDQRLGWSAVTPSRASWSGL